MFPNSLTKLPSDCVLVVDDSATNRMLLRTILNNGGYQVHELQDGGECLAFCEKELPSMILLDVMMPNIDGLMACRKLRELHSKAELPIIMVTTLAETEGLAESLAAGANDYVMKPIDRATLLARIENQMALSRAQRHIEHQAKVLEKSLRIQNAMGDMLPEAIVIHDEHGHIIYSNRTCLHFCANTSQVEMPTLFRTIFAGKFSVQLEEFYSQVMQNPAVEIAHEFSGKHAPFQEVSLFSRPIAIEGGFLRLWLWRDQTVKRALERAVNQRVKLDTVGLFAAGVAHNFNNIMGGILGASEVLERLCGENERTRRCVSVIKRGLDAGIRLTRKMNAVYHKDLSNTADIDNDIGLVLERVVSCYALSLDERIAISLKGESNLPCVAMSGQALVEVFGNVISNAVEAISGSGSIAISALHIAGESCVEVTVEDTGSGMTEPVLQRIYEPFFSTRNFDQLSGVSVEGRGLGMWNTYNAIQGCGGSIRIESQPGRGSLIVLRFPTIST